MSVPQIEADIKSALKQYHPGEQFFRVLRLIVWGAISTGVADQLVNGTLTRQALLVGGITVLEALFRWKIPAVTVNQATDGVVGLVSRLLGAPAQVPPVSGPAASPPTAGPSSLGPFIPPPR